MIIINDTLGAYGGGQTLILRMSSWLRNRNYKVLIICDNNDNTEIVNNLYAIGVSIIRLDVKRTKELISLLRELSSLESIMVINFAWNQYLDIEIAKRYGRLCFNNILYCIHPETFNKGSFIRNSFLSRLVKRNLSILYFKMLSNHSIIMQDEIDIECTEKYLNIKHIEVPTILRIPMEISEYENYENIITQGYSSPIILAASRAEFPWKGFLVGLIDDYEKLREEGIDCRLELVSEGNDIDILIDRIEKIKEEYRNQVILHRWLSYSDLKKLILRCRLFVGLGSTMLDAAGSYKPCVVSTMNTMSNCAMGYFSDYPQLIQSPEGCSRRAFPLIKDIFRWGREEYHINSVKSYEELKKNYSIDLIMSELIKLRNYDNGCILNIFERIFHFLLNIIRMLKRKSEREFDYKKIKKEKLE